LATGGGLNKFDSTTEIVTRYQHDPDNPNSLSDNDLREILIDRTGIIWIGTASGGLNKFDPTTETFTHYQQASNKPNSLGSNRVSALLEDSAGRLWVGTHKGGLQYLNPNSNTFTTYHHNPDDPTSLTDNTVTTLFEPESGRLLIGTNVGLSGFNPTTETFTQFNTDPSNTTSQEGNGVQVIVPVQDEPGWFWLGTDQSGLKKFNPATEETLYYQHNSLLPNSLSDNDVITIFTDQSGVVWVGTRSGLNKFSPLTQQFPYETHRPGIPNTLSDDFVQTIYQDETGLVWLGTNAGGLNQFDPDSGLYTHFLHDPNEPNSPLSDDIEGIEAGQPGELWLGYDVEGLSKFEVATGRFTHYLPDNDILTSLPTGRIQRSLHYDPTTDKLWIGLDGGGVATFDPNTDRFTTYQHQPDQTDSLTSNRIKQIYQDQTGMIWAGTVKPELNKLDRTTGRVTRYFYETDEPDARVTILYQAADGVMWVRAGRALLKFDPTTGQFFADDETALWDNDSISKISVDQQGNYWFGDEPSLSRYNPQTKTITRFDQWDGFITCCRGWFLNQQTGQLFTSGSDERGFHSITLDSLQPRIYQSQVVLTGFHLFGQPAEIGDESPLQQAIFTTDHLTLAYSDNFAFEFSALDYTAPESINYEYRLDGF
ncbi:MAG: two-component regulator propeller domain-containing protein, partial [Chloroflexota bacterium]